MARHKTPTAWVQETVQREIGQIPVGDREASEIIGPNGSAFQPLNWAPKNAVNRITEASSPRSEYVQVVWETMGNFVNYAGANTAALDDPIPLPSGYWPATPEYLAAECYALAPQLAGGSIGEWLATEQISQTPQFTVISTEQAEIALEKSWTEIEDSGVDVVAKTPDGRVVTFQVKTSESQAKQYDGVADIVLVVNISEGKVEIF